MGWALIKAIYFLPCMQDDRLLCADTSCVRTTHGGTKATAKVTTPTTRTRMPMGDHDYGLHHFLSEVRRFWYDHGLGGQVLKVC